MALVIECRFEGRLRPLSKKVTNIRLGRLTNPIAHSPIMLYQYDLKRLPTEFEMGHLLQIWSRKRQRSIRLGGTSPLKCAKYLGKYGSRGTHMGLWKHGTEGGEPSKFGKPYLFPFSVRRKQITGFGTGTYEMRQLARDTGRLLGSYWYSTLTPPLPTRSFTIPLLASSIARSLMLDMFL